MTMASSSSVGEQQVWPPGFRFHPTDEELVLYHLKKKICRRRLKLEIIGETDVYMWDPEDLPGLSKLRTGDRQWFFFTPRDRRYLNGARSNRGAPHGYWKATGKDRNITCNSRPVGIKKTLVFYKGRAPNGERTNWVMHEYTLDEAELNRCQTPWDNYALYKLFKKDGPGPKNGAQYGAPFKEEDWCEDEFAEEKNHIAEQENPSEQLHEIPSVDNLRVNSQVQSSLNDIDEVLGKIMDEPTLPTSAFTDTDSTHDLSQIFGEVSHTYLADPSIKQANFTERSLVWHPCNQQFGVDSTPNLQFYDALEVTSAPNIYEQNLQISEDDFLEMDDLIGPEYLQLNELDHGLSEFDLFHDATMFFRDIGSIDQEMGSNVYTNNRSDLDDESQIHNQLWGHDLKSNAFTPTEPGAIYPNNATNIPTEPTLNQTDQKDDNSDQNWLTSALWAFVESIPSTPASASENALVNRAFERISSFSRVRINAANTNLVACTNGTETAKNSCKIKGFFLFSVLGVFFAILWVFMKGGNVYMNT